MAQVQKCSGKHMSGSTVTTSCPQKGRHYQGIDRWVEKSQQSDPRLQLEPPGRESPSQDYKLNTRKHLGAHSFLNPLAKTPVYQRYQPEMLFRSGEFTGRSVSWIRVVPGCETKQGSLQMQT